MDLRELKVLVIEDNQFMRRIIRSVLNSLRCANIREARDGVVGLKVLNSGFDADIIIVDWSMPTMDGIEFSRLIRTAENSPNPYVPIIMVTGHSEPTRISEARDAGVNEFVVKPISAKTLFSRIEAVVKRPRTFVRCKTYFGPDRRRHSKLRYTEPERRKQPPEETTPEDTDPREVDFV